jgi:hypothetical protein
VARRQRRQHGGGAEYAARHSVQKVCFGARTIFIQTTGILPNFFEFLKYFLKILLKDNFLTHLYDKGCVSSKFISTYLVHLSFKESFAPFKFSST